MRIVLAERYGAFLNRAAAAEALCQEILPLWASEPIILDFEGIAQITPSFAHALLFNLLSRADVDCLRTRVRFENMSDYVRDAVNAAISRKVEDKARLTAYV